MSRRRFFGKREGKREEHASSSSSSEEELEPVQSLRQSTYRSSLFSSNRTCDTNSTVPTSAQSSSGNQPKGFLSSIDSMGKPLRVMAADKYNELSRMGTIQSNASSSLSRRRRSELSEQFEHPGAAVAVDTEVIEHDVEVLSESLLELVDSVNQSNTDVSKATIRIVELLDESVNNVQLQSPLAQGPVLQNVYKVCLQFHDTFLRLHAYEDSKRLLIRSLASFQRRLGFQLQCDLHDPVPYLQNFAIPYDDGEVNLPNLSRVELIMEKLASTSSLVSDQQGAFIAPVLRGLSKSTSVLSIMFGFPEPQDNHYEVINALFRTFPDVHFFVVKNSILLAGGVSTATRFHTPFKVPTRSKPEISISVSSVNSVKSSGTLGGYIQPKITQSTDKSLLKYKGAKFALTCAHVLLSEDQDYPDVSVPSTVMLNTYKSALRDEMDRYPKDSMEHDSYSAELQSVDKYSFPLGQVVWGERIVLKNKRLSDIAIVKLDDSLQVTENSLGDEVDSYNPSLKFQNTKVKKVIGKDEYYRHSRVFKIGASSNYTTGYLNSVKMVYWLDGSIQTSEFVVSNSAKSMFAMGGDSGSLILNDLQDQAGLGVLGMLHSYDGERREIGLFTPMDELLKRLQDVTGVEWVFI